MPSLTSLLLTVTLTSALTSALTPASALAATTGYSPAYKSDLKIYNESARTETALTLSLEGVGAKHLYASLAETEKFHRGLYLKNSADGKILCQRGEDASKLADYFCELDLAR